MTTTINIGDRVRVIFPDSIPSGHQIAGHAVRVTFDGAEVDNLVSVSVWFAAAVDEVAKQNFLFSLISPHHDPPSDFIAAVKAEGARVFADYAVADGGEWQVKRREL
jgi:hypothetical protein